MNCSWTVQMLFKFHGNIQICLIIFELVLEVFMKCSKILNTSWTLAGPPQEPCGALCRKFFFSDFKNTVVKGTLTILGGKNNSSVIDTFRVWERKKICRICGKGNRQFNSKLVDSNSISFKMQLCKTIWVYHVYKCNATTVLWATLERILSSLFFSFITQFFVDSSFTGLNPWVQTIILCTHVFHQRHIHT